MVVSGINSNVASTKSNTWNSNTNFSNYTKINNLQDLDTNKKISGHEEIIQSLTENMESPIDSEETKKLSEFVENFEWEDVLRIGNNLGKKLYEIMVPFAQNKRLFQVVDKNEVQLVFWEDLHFQDTKDWNSHKYSDILYSIFVQDGKYIVKNMTKEEKEALSFLYLPDLIASTDTKAQNNKSTYQESFDKVFGKRDQEWFLGKRYLIALKALSQSIEKTKETKTGIKVSHDTQKYRESVKKVISHEIKILKSIAHQVRESKSWISYQELITEVFANERVKHLSQESVYRIKREVFSLLCTEKKIEKIFKQEDRNENTHALIDLIFDWDEEDDESYDDVYSILQDKVDIKVHRFYISIYIKDKDAYDLLDGGWGSESTAWFKTIINNIPIMVVKWTRGAEIDTHNHEYQHIESHFLISSIPLISDEEELKRNNESGGIKNTPNDEIETLNSAKDEMIAFLKEEMPPDDIKDILTNELGLYTSDLEGEAWDRHCEKVKKYLDIIRSMLYVDCDILAICPIQYRKRLPDIMPEFTEDINKDSVVPVLCEENFKDFLQKANDRAQTPCLWTDLISIIEKYKPAMYNFDEAGQIEGLTLDWSIRQDKVVQYEIVATFIQNLTNNSEFSSYLQGNYISEELNSLSYYINLEYKYIVGYSEEWAKEHLKQQAQSLLKYLSWQEPTSELVEMITEHIQFPTCNRTKIVDDLKDKDLQDLPYEKHN